MKIIVVGSYDHWNALERHYINYLRPMVSDVQLYSWPNIIGNYYGKNLLRRIQYRFKIATYWKIRSFNRDLYQHVASAKPDILWIYKGVDILPETLSRIHELGIKLVNYNPDHPFIRTFRSGGGKEIEGAIPFYDLIFTYSNEVAAEIQKRYQGKVKLVNLPFGYDIPNETEEKLHKAEQSGEEELRVCFIGNPDNELRYKLLSYLIDQQLPVDIFGSGWNRYFKSKNTNARIFHGVYGDDYWLTLRKYRVQLNIFRPHNFNSHNMRTFEIPAVGGIQVAPDSDEHREFFQEGKEIFLFRSDEEVVAICQRLLSMPKDEVSEIRNASLLRCRNGQYAYKDRASIVFQSFSSLLNGE